jgi:hypothetical protein
VEQVCSALNLLCRQWQESRRGTREREHRLETIGYHQRRNRAASRARGPAAGGGVRPPGAEAEVHGLAIASRSAVQLGLP